MSNTEVENKVTKISEVNGSVKEKTPRNWVKFDDESTPTTPTSDPLSESTAAGIPTAATATPSTSDTCTPERPAVLRTETVHVNLERGDRHIETVTPVALSKNVEFVNVCAGFGMYLSVHLLVIRFISFILALISIVSSLLSIKIGSD